MIHRFIHIFKNGQKLSLICDLSKDLPTFTTEDNKNVDIENNQEYVVWYNVYVLPWLMNNLSSIQINNLSKVGAEELKKEFKKNN